MLTKLTTLAKDIANFFQNRDNPHRVTAEQVGAYSHKEYDEKYDKPYSLDKQSWPIDRYGDQGWLPINVSGSFEGATRNERDVWAACKVEDDGTYIALINGTNGVKEGVYFSKVTVDINNNPIAHTPLATEYRPAFLTENEWINAVYGNSTRTAVWGDLQGNASFDSWFCLTNDTLDPTKHRGVRFNRPAEISRGGGVSFVSGPYAYLMVQSSNFIEVVVYRCPVTDILTKASVNFTKVTNIASNGVRGNNFTGDLIKVANIMAAPTVEEVPLFLEDSGGKWYPAEMVHIWGDVDPETGDIWMRVTRSGQVWVMSAYIPVALGYTVIYSPSTNTARLPDTQKDGFLIKTVEYSPLWKATTVDGRELQHDDFVIALNKQPHDSCAVGNYGRGFKIMYSNEGPGILQPFECKSFTTPHEFWDFLKSPCVNAYNIGLTRYYPSTFGDAARVPLIISTNKIAAFSYSNDPDNKWGGKDTLSLTEYGNADFQYTTPRSGNMMGFKPSPRVDIKSKIKAGHCEYSNSNNEFSLGGGHLAERERYTFTSVSEDLVYSGRVGMNDTLWENVRQQMKGFLTPEQRALPMTAMMEVQVFNSPELPAIAFMSIMFEDGSKTGQRIVATLHTKEWDGEITEATVGHLWNNDTVYNAIRVNVRDISYAVPSMAYFNVEEKFTLVVAHSHYYVQTTSNGTTLSLSAMIDLGQKEYQTDWFKIHGNNPWYFGITQHAYIPRLGFGRYNDTLNRTLSGTAITFTLFGKSREDVKRWSGSANYMIISQQSPVGWFAHITESVPCLIDGKYKLMPPVTFDLTKYKDNPANTRFYITVVELNKGPEYRIETLYGMDFPSTMLIGLIETDSVKIASAYVQRVTRLDTYRLSAQQVGNAIPVIPGLPTEPATLTWVKNQ